MSEIRLGDCSSTSARATRIVSVAEITTSSSESLTGRTSPWTIRPDFKATTAEV